MAMGLYEAAFSALTSALSRAKPAIWMIRPVEGTLRALVTASQHGPVTLVATGDGITIGDDAHPPMRSGMDTLATTMAGHGIGHLAAHGDASPADLLAAARLLAGAPESERSTAERLLHAGATTVRFVEPAVAVFEV